MDLSTPGVKAELERQLDVEPLDFTAALRELFFFRRMRVVMTLFDLMKARACEYDSESSHQDSSWSHHVSKKRDKLMCLTNQLFRDGLGSEIMSLITDQLNLLLDSTKRKSTSFTEKMIQYLQRLAECLFYMFYKTQIERDEADKLLELIRVLSNALIPTISDKLPAAAHDLSSTTGSILPDNMPADVSLYPTLVILQLTHVRALNQVTIFFSRSIDVAPYGNEEQGNALLGEQDTEWDYGKDLLSSEACVKWENRMVRGFTCFSLGVVREPFVEAMTMATAECTLFFEKAADCNAYSYISLCLIPTIQCYDDLNSVDSADFRNLLMSTLVGDTSSGLIVDLMNCYVNKCYHMEFPFCEWDREQERYKKKEYLDNLINESSESPDRVIFTNNLDDNVPISCDCLDDVLDLLTVTVMAQPAFAQKLWHSSGTKHPFITAILAIVDEYGSLDYPAMRFLTAIANSQQPNFAFNVFSLKNLNYWMEHFKLIEEKTADLVKIAGGTQLQQVYSEYDAPAPPDEYWLEHAVNLLGSVMRDPRVSQEFIAQQFDPVRTLFNLLVGQVGVALKGAVMRALASLCQSLSVDGGVSFSATDGLQQEVLEQVWSYLEQYQLLPSTAIGTGKHGTSRNYGGLHYELEHVESGTLGQYPATLGFLTLLVALLDQDWSVGSCVPQNLGYGDRIPGIVCYVDYIIGEILLKLETRRYLPANFSGEGQKWKVATLSVRVLTLIIQKYNINSLTAGDVQNSSNFAAHSEQSFAVTSIFESPGDEIRSMALDFQDVSVSYPLVVTDAAPRQQSLQQQHQHQQYALTTAQSKRTRRDEMRPKTVGFAVMSSLLDQKRGLLFFLLQILQENSPKNISNIRQQEMLHLASLSVQDCKENSELSMHHVRESIAGSLRDIDPPQSAQHYQYYQQQFQQQQYHQGQPHVSVFFNEEVMGTRVGWDDMFYDNAHWRLQAAAAVVGLLHEAALREVAFMDRIRAAGPLTMRRSAGGGSQIRSATSVLVDVQVVPLSTSLVTDMQAFQLTRHLNQGQREVESELPLSCVMAYLSFLPEKKTLVCTPSLEILSLGILKHVALNQTNRKVLHSLKDMGVNALKMIENCNYFIENCNSMTEDQGYCSDSVHRHSGCVGEVPMVQKFTLSSVDSVRPAMRVNPSDEPSQNDFQNKREVVLDLLLTTLRPKDECLCHYLLFGLEGICDVDNNMKSDEGRTSNCVEAILDLLCVGGSGGDISANDYYVAVTYPFQALQCFELIYRLYMSPLTSVAIKQVVARRSSDLSIGHFMINFLKFYLEYNRKKLTRIGNHGESYSLEDTARLNCSAFALKIVALEFTQHSHVNENENVEQIMKMLFDQNHEYAEDSGATTSDTTSNLLCQLLSLVPLSLDFSFGTNAHDPTEAVMIQCMRESSKPYVLSQGKPYQYPGRNVNFSEPPGDFLFVDIPHCILLLKTYFKYSSTSTGAASLRRPPSEANVDPADEAKLTYAVQVAMEYNTYISTMAAMANFCHAFRQIIEISLFKYSTVLLGNYQLITSADPRDQVLEGVDHEHKVLQTAESAINKLVTFSIAPCLGLLVQSPAMEMVLAEQLAKSLMAMFDTLRSITLEAKAAQEKCGTGINTPPPLTAACFSDLLTNLILAILRRGSVGSPRHASSSSFRSNLYLSFFSLLQSGADMICKGNIGYSVQEDIQNCSRDILQTYVVEIMEVMGDDIALGTNLSTKTSLDQSNDADNESLLLCASSAFSALTGVLAVLGPAVRDTEKIERGGFLSQQLSQSSQLRLSSSSKRFHDSLHVSPGHLHGLHTLLDRGYLIRILSSVGLTSSAERGGPPEIRSNFKRQKSDYGATSDVNTLESVLSLCGHLACSVDGTNILLDLGLFSALNTLPLIPIPTHASNIPAAKQRTGLPLADMIHRVEEETKDPFCIDNLDFLLNRKKVSTTSVSSSPQWLSDENIDVMLSLLLQLFRSALSNSSCPDILEQAAMFLTRNHTLVAHYLRLQSPTLAGLEICHAIVSLFCMVGSGPPVRSSSNSTISLPSWESYMGGRGDMLTSELSKLLTALGASPLPADMCPLPMSGAGTSSRQSQRSSSWWTVVNPCSGMETDMNKTLVDTPLCLRGLASSRSLTSSVSKWSSFDHSKFSLGLKIIERSTSFFRIRCNEWVKLATSMANNGEDHRQSEFGGDLSAFYDKLGLGLLKLDFAVLSFTFQSLGNLYLQLSHSHEQQEQHRHGQNWLQSPHVFGDLEGVEGRRSQDQDQDKDEDIRVELLHAVESLLCSLFDISKASTANDKFYASHDIDEQHLDLQTLEDCMHITNKFPSHSFVYQIGKTLVEI